MEFGGCAFTGATAPFVRLNHPKSQSFAGGNPDPLRRLQAERVRKIYDDLRAGGAEFVAVLGDLNKGPDKTNPTIATRDRPEEVHGARLSGRCR